jgi:hypothetical protein
LETCLSVGARLSHLDRSFRRLSFLLHEKR